MTNKREKLYEKIYNDICGQVASGVLKVGDKLPTEEELTSVYGVSRITVNKAMNELRANNVVVRYPKKGTFINKNLNYKVSQKRFLIPLVLILPEAVNSSYRILEAIQSVGLENDCIIPYYNSGNQPEIESQILHKLLKLQIDGLILFPCSEYSNIEIISEFAVREIPICFVDRRTIGIPGSVVTSNNKKGMSELVQSLIDRGHTKIASVINTHDASQTEIERFNGYCQTLIKNRIPVNRSYLLNSANYYQRYVSKKHQERLNFLESFFRSTAERYLKLTDPPTAICCGNDNDAVNLIDAFRKVCGKLPDQLAVTGFDNLTFGDEHPIDTVAQDFYQIGKTAIEIVLQKILHPYLPDSVVEIDTKLCFNQTKQQKQGE